LSGTALPGISVSPASYDFGALDAGTSATTFVTITNDDSSAVTLATPFAISSTLPGDTPGDFSVGVPGVTTLAGGGSTSVAVGFLPSAAGGKSATLTIGTTAGSLRTVRLIGSSACPAITIGGTFTAGVLNTPYARGLSASGGASPYTFSVSAGTAPSGLALSNTGVLSGTPTFAGSYTFSVQASDSLGCAGSASFTVPILAATISATPNPLDFGPVPDGSPASMTVTITNTSAFAVTLGAPAVTGANASQFSAGTLAATSLATGASTTLPVTFTPASFGAKAATLAIVSSGGGSVTVPLAGSGLNVSVGSTLLISEFRFHGPAGASDEFVEIYNNTDLPIDISGYTLRGSNNAGTNSVRATVAPATVLPAHGHFLFVNTTPNTGYSGLVTGNATYTSGITDDGGVAIARPDGTLLDQVGLSVGSAYRESTPIRSFIDTSLNESYERKQGGVSGSSFDTGDNNTDFTIRTNIDPQNLASPIVPPLFTVSPAPYDFGSVALGTSIDTSLTITNTSTATVTLTTPFTLAGADAGQFAVGAPASASLGAGITTTVSVTFAPSVTLGPRNASLTIASPAGGTRVVDLFGAAACPVIHVGSVAGGVAYGAAYADAFLATGGRTPYAFRTSGGSLPPGLVLGDDGSLAGTAGAAGDYAFTVQATDANGCQGMADVAIAVTRAPLTIAAADATREFGAANPMFTGAVTGVVNGDAITGSFTSGAVPSSHEGSYPIVAAAIDPGGRVSNYSLTLVNGVLTVVDTHPPVLTLTPASAVANSPSGAVVNFAASASDPVDGALPISCAPSSGSVFPIGVTTVSCSATDSNGHTSAGSLLVTVNPPDAPGRMAGDAVITAGSARHQFAFAVQERSTGADAGAISYQLRTTSGGRPRVDTFLSLRVTNVSFYDVPGVAPGSRPPSGIDTVTFEGVGSWNGREGFRFTARATDAGEPGRGHDRFAITIVAPDNTVVATVDATITDGNIQSLRIAH
jgi:hypothetical protein